MERKNYYVSNYLTNGLVHVWAVNPNTNGLIPLNLNGDVFWQYPAEAIQYHFAS